MDILISSNLERLLFELAEPQLSSGLRWMKKLSAQGWYAISRECPGSTAVPFLRRIRRSAETAAAIKETFAKHGYLLDPHSAVGYSVLRRYREETGDTTPALLVSTASPFKFNQAVLEALGSGHLRER